MHVFSEHVFQACRLNFLCRSFCWKTLRSQGPGEGPVFDTRAFGAHPFSVILASLMRLNSKAWSSICWARTTA